MTEAELKDVILRDVERYFEEFSEPLRLAVISQRHGKRVRGVEIGELLRGDSRFVVRTTNTDARLVWPSEALRQAFAGDTLFSYMSAFDLKR